MKNIKKLPFILSILSLLTIFAPANADVKVVTSIKPIHSLASYLMDGVGKPDLIVDGYASPHGFALKPSHAKMLQEADICLLYTSPSPRDRQKSRMPSSA